MYTYYKLSHQPSCPDPPLGIFIPGTTLLPWLWEQTHVWGAVATFKYQLTRRPNSSHGVNSQMCSGGSFMKPWMLLWSSNANFMGNQKLQKVLALSLKEWSKRKNKYCAVGGVTARSYSKGLAVIYIPREAELAIPSLETLSLALQISAFVK